MSASITIDDKDFQRVLQKWADGSRRANVDVLKQQAKHFVRDCYGITPPSKDYKVSKKLGEAAVRADIRKIFRGARAGSRKAIPNPAEVHNSYRKSNGRVKAELQGRDKIPVVGLQAYIKSIVAKVGILAAGWNVAAKKFGVRIAPWIARHGAGGGNVVEVSNNDRVSLEITQGIEHGSDVDGFDRRVAASLKKRKFDLLKQLNSRQRRAAEKAGLKAA